MRFLKAWIVVFIAAWCIVTVYSVAPEDEPLQMLFDSFLPNGFLEKPFAGAKSSAKSRVSEASSATAAEMMKAAEAMASGLKNIVDSLNSPDNGDCKFTCSNGAKPKHLTGYRPMPNGCGTHGIQADTSDLPGITECCNQHDICYGTCNSGQRECDSQFNNCMVAACEQMQKEGRFKTDLQAQECRGLGATFYLATASVGCEFYRDAQRSACLCDAGLPGARASTDEAEKQEKIRRYNSQKRARESKRSRGQRPSADEDESAEYEVDLSSPLFDLPEAIDHTEL